MSQNTQVTKEEAKSLGLVRYWSDVPCKRGHVGERYVKNSTCIECHKNRRKDNWKTYSREQKREWRRKRNYNLSNDEWWDLWYNQLGCCAICNREMVIDKEDNPTLVACIDHDHKQGNVRGLLCFDCNVGIAKFYEDISRFENAIEYIRDNGG